MADKACVICGGSPCLRKVGSRGYCKKHIKESFNDRDAAIKRWRETNAGRVPGSDKNSATQTLARIVAKSRHRRKRVSA